MSADRKIAAVAEEIEKLLMEKLDGPRDAAKALLIAHVLLSNSQGFDRNGVAGMLDEYGRMFRKAYFGVEQ
jgi:hypothetical protein